MRAWSAGRRARAAALLLLALIADPPLGRGGDAPPSAAVGFDPDRQALARIESPPLGLPPVPLPEGVEYTAELIALGRKLFFDRRLSVNGTMSCAMCHIPEQGFTNHELARPIGVGGRSLRRNAPTILNAAYLLHAFHDGRRSTLETQVLDPLVDPRELANPDVESVLARIRGLPDYAGRFESAFAGGPTPERLAAALAGWERTLLAGDSPFDRWRYRGEKGALNAQQLRGFKLFTGRAGCVACHPVGDRHALFTDGRFHNTGIGYFAAEIGARDTARVPVEIAPGVVVPLAREVVRSVGLPPQPDSGRYEVTRDARDLWSYRTPSLRNVALTSPYMHDGSLRTLEDVVRHYARGGIPNKHLDPAIRPLDLTEDDRAALTAFLESLTSSSVDELVRDARSAAIGN